ncbi:MAG: Ig-like domain-containing protein [Spirochaetaceae bacterium]|nr:Ig-like domain-containing protein [Spirochaetaceae bacterium]
MRAKPGIAALIAVALLVSACKLVNLEPFGFETFPAERNQSIPSDSVVWVSFQDSVDHIEAENAAELRNDSGIVEVDYSWEGKRMLITPLSPWVTGLRYVLTLRGEFNLDDGRQYSVDMSLPFYIGAASLLPTLVDYSPADEAIVPLDQTLILTFSDRMDTESFERDFSLSPDQAVDISWNAGGDVVSINPEGSWTGLTRYSGVLPETITDERGVPLVREYRFHFRTLTDISAPVLVRSVPWSIPGDAALTMETLNEDINNNKGIYLEFDRPMDWSNWDSAWTIEPETEFQSLVVSDSAIALLPEAPWIPDQNYLLTLNTELSDASGNSPAANQEIAFTCPIPVQKVLTIEHSPADPDTDLSAGIPAGPIPLNVVPGLIKTHSFTFVLARPILPAELTGYVDSFYLDAVFPSTISPVSVSSVSLESPYRILLIFSGFSEPAADTGIEYLYRLGQRADREGTINDEGSYVTEDWNILFSVGDGS